MDFDKVAQEWDTSSRIERAQIISKEIRKNLNDKKGGKALEFGCGTGLISFNITDFFNNITLIDSSEEMIKVVHNKIELSGLRNIKGICSDILNNEENLKYDVIYSSMVLHHINDIETLLKKFNRILNSKGKLCIVDLNEDDGKFHGNEEGFSGHNGFSQKKLSDVFMKSGFNNIRTYTFFYGNRIVNGEAVKYSLFIIIGEII